MATLVISRAAAANFGIVVGTGQQSRRLWCCVSYTKYGDGGVDISPIADCTKSQVWELGKHLGVSGRILLILNQLTGCGTMVEMMFNNLE